MSNSITKKLAGKVVIDTSRARTHGRGQRRSARFPKIQSADPSARADISALNLRHGISFQIKKNQPQAATLS